MRRIVVVFAVLAVGASGASLPAVAETGSWTAPVVKAPDRVQVLEARRMAHRAILRWKPASGGARPTGYQVRLAGTEWRKTKKPIYKVKGLRADRAYRVTIRAVRKRAVGAPVVIRLFRIG